MSTLPPSNSEAEASQLPNLQQQQPKSINRQRYRDFVIMKLAILAAPLILLLGCANFASISTFWVLPPGKETDSAGEITSHDAGDLSIPFTRPDPGENVTVTPTAPEPLLFNIVSTPTLFPQPEPTIGLEPIATLTPTPIVTSPLEIKYVVIITIDGLRPDALELADTPTLDNLRAKGAYSPDAQTVIPSFTLPSHVSMLDGALPQKHGIVEALPCIGCRLTIGPTLFSVAHKAGLSTGVVVGKEKLSYLILPNSVDKLLCADVHDTEVKNQAVKFIKAGLPNVLFIHFPDTDRVGHAYGWMSENQLYAINFVDGLIGQVVAALEGSGYLDRTLIIITADHGGHGFRHGDDSPVDRTIPWLAVGPGVPQDVILTNRIDTFDTAATALYALDLPIPEEWVGQPVLEIFE